MMMKVRSFVLLITVATATDILSSCFAFSTTPSLYDDYAAAQQRKALQEEEFLRRPGGANELPFAEYETKEEQS